MSYERVPTPENVWEYQLNDTDYRDELLQVTYKSGSRVLISRKDDYWVVDPEFMPEDLRSQLIKYDGEELRLMRIVTENHMSGYVGHSVTFRIWSNESSFPGRDATCTSLSPVAKIEIVSRVDVDLAKMPVCSAAHFDMCG